MSATSRLKGQRGEREVAAILESELGVPVRRQLGQERDGGADIHVLGARIQVKRCERGAVSAWWAQTLVDAGDGVPVLVYRASRRPWRVVIRLGDLTGDGSGYPVEMDLPALCYVLREGLR